MTDIESIRLECLRIASAESRGMGPSVIEIAERYATYVRFGVEFQKQAPVQYPRAGTGDYFGPG